MKRVEQFGKRIYYIFIFCILSEALDHEGAFVMRLLYSVLLVMTAVYFFDKGKEKIKS